MHSFETLDNAVNTYKQPIFVELSFIPLVIKMLKSSKIASCNFFLFTDLSKL